jgi:predicted outer membrane repeat protein
LQSLFPDAITLTSGEIVIENDPLTIQGPGSGQLVLRGVEDNRLFNIAAGSPVTLSGLTLQNGDGGSTGGAIYSVSDLVISDVHFLENSSGADGGALYVAGNLTVQNSSWLSNTANGEGGALLVVGDQAQISGSTFQNNWSGSTGGAIYATCDLLLEDTDLISNTALILAGGVWNYGPAQISGTTFLRNTAVNLDIGALYVQDALEIHASSFISNSAGRDVGAVWADDQVQISASNFISNSAAPGGTAAAEIYGDIWFTGTQWLANQAGAGGTALLHMGENGRLVNTLFADNTGGSLLLEHSGAVQIWYSTFATPTTSTLPALTIAGSGIVTAQNNIFAGEMTAISVAAGSLAETYNLFDVRTAISGTTEISEKSFTGPAGFQDPAAGNYHLIDRERGVKYGRRSRYHHRLDGDARPRCGGYDLGYDEASFNSDAAIGKSVVSTPAVSEPITYYLHFTNTGPALLPHLTHHRSAANLGHGCDH